MIFINQLPFFMSPTCCSDIILHGCLSHKYFYFGFKMFFNVESIHLFCYSISKVQQGAVQTKNVSKYFLSGLYLYFLHNVSKYFNNV